MERLSRFWPWLREERRRIAASVAVMLLAAAFKLAEPWPLKFVLDRVLPAGAGDPAARGWLIGSVLTLVLVIGGRASLDYVLRVEFAKIGNRVLRRVRARVYDHITRLSLAFHRKQRSGDLIVRMTRDVSLMRDAAATSLLPLIGNVLVLSGMAAIVLALQWRLALLALAVLPLLAWVAGRQGRGLYRAAGRQRAREGALASSASESVQAIQEVQALSLQERLGREFARREERNLAETLRSARLSAGLARSVDLCGAVSLGAVLAYGSWLVLAGRLSAGDLVVFMTYLKRALKPAKDFAKHSGRLAKAAAAGDRVFEILEHEPLVRDREDARPAPRLRGAIAFDDVRFHYEKGRVGLSGLSFDVRPGERVAVVGPSGSGKTTLISLLLRLYDPDTGAIRIDGHDIRGWTLTSLREQIGVVLQDSVLFAGTVAENIALGGPEADGAALRRAAVAAQADRFVRALPHGYDTPIGERGATLSLGQRRRISIARALLREAPILVLDEPTAGLDRGAARGIAAALESVPATTTVLLATHDEELAARADRVVRLRAGRIEPPLPVCVTGRAE